MCSFADRMPNDFTAAKNENEKEKKIKEWKEIESSKTHNIKAVLRAPHTLKGPINSKGQIHSKGPHTL